LLSNNNFQHEESKASKLDVLENHFSVQVCPLWYICISVCDSISWKN